MRYLRADGSVCVQQPFVVVLCVMSVVGVEEKLWVIIGVQQLNGRAFVVAVRWS